MSPSRPSPPFPIALSRTCSFITVLLSDLDGPSKRQRLVVRERPLPDWLGDRAPLLGSGFDLVVVAMGKARLGSRTRIQSIVVYPARPDAPEVAYVYVEEREAEGRGTRDAAPVHVVRCAKLPKVVRFVEVSPRSTAPRPLLKALRDP